MNKELLNAITPASNTYDKELALELAKDWNNTDEKWMFVTDTFHLSNSHQFVDILVDRIEIIFEKLLDHGEHNERLGNAHQR